ncbi:MAG TPA: hypothetical protein VFE53_18430 [Mucilaginibacter sp.]|jgi:hypothetical protein|nr:hypothetical protein [Mucilaginibacter sp.]
MNLSSLLSEWIKKIETENPPPANITAINFGMFTSDKGYMVYVTGSEVYDPDDDDWVGEIDYQPARKIKYLLVPREFTTGLKWAGVLDLMVKTLKELADAQPGGVLFGGRVLTAGYDDGELVLVKAV